MTAEDHITRGCTKKEKETTSVNELVLNVKVTNKKIQVPYFVK